MIKSKAQAQKLYTLYKEGKVTYSDMMKAVHETGDMKKLPKKAIDLAL